MLCTASSASSSRCCPLQYDPLSYARNFDHRGGGGFGAGPDEDVDVRYTFASRFVLSASSARQTQ